MKQEFTFSNSLDNNPNSNPLEYQPQIFYPVSSTPPTTSRQNEYMPVESTAQQHQLQQLPFDYSSHVNSRARNQSLPITSTMHYHLQPLQRHSSFPEDPQLIFHQQLYYPNTQQFPQNDYTNTPIQIQSADSPIIVPIGHQSTQLSQQLNNQQSQQQHHQNHQQPIHHQQQQSASIAATAATTVASLPLPPQQQQPQQQLQSEPQQLAQASNTPSRSNISSPSNSFSPTTPPPQSHLMSTFSSKTVVKSTKKHVCEICGKRFTRPSSLQTHSYSHTGEKPFKCDVDGCGRHFSVVSNLRRHKKIHGL